MPRAGRENEPPACRVRRQWRVTPATVPLTDAGGGSDDDVEAARRVGGGGLGDDSLRGTAGGRHVGSSMLWPRRGPMWLGGALEAPGMFRP